MGSFPIFLDMLMFLLPTREAVIGQEGVVAQGSLPNPRPVRDFSAHKYKWIETISLEE